MIWNKVKECMSRDELAALQGKRLVRLVKHMYQNAGYYRKKMLKLGLEPGDIRGIEDLHKLPFTTREDLTEAYPNGIFAMAGSDIIRFHTSDHTAGIETVAGYSQNDIHVWSECMARSISMADMGKNDVIQIAGRYGLSADGLGALYGAEKMGAAVIPASDCRPAALVAMMRRLQTTGIISTPSSLMKVAQFVEERRLKGSLRLRTAMCGGESWTESAREKIQDKLGIKVYDIFGLNELTGLGVACECECQRGMHVQEDFFVAEILDTHTLLVLPDGRRGELVFTTLQKEGIPLIRYRTMHISKMSCAKCECGRTMTRIDRIFDSADEILYIRGEQVYAFQIESALSDLEGMEASYIVCIRKDHNFDRVDIYIKNGRTEKYTADRKHRVAEAVCKVVGMMPNVHDADDGIMKLSGGDFVNDFMEKRVIIVDERND